ncbi:MAG: hypothetical protein MMC33_000936 [Icmadophila ericetorum]|nr:hypothetical protein [Icmadophila ericetorum]
MDLVSMIPAASVKAPFDVTNGGDFWYTHNLHAVVYDGEPHLAYSGQNHGRHVDYSSLVQGKNVILNDGYNVVKSWDFPGGNTTLNVHEFELFSSTNDALWMADDHIKMDLSPWGGLKNDTLIATSFQDFNLATGSINFQWHAFDHIPIDESCQPYENKWDYFHLNSVNKELSEGNYVINGYHGCAIYSVNGTDGSIIWRLGGFKSDFHILDGYELRHMHHVRLRSLESTKLPASVRSQISSQTHIALSIFDNGFNGIMAPTASSSSAIVLLLDLLARTAQVVERYTPPFDSPVQYAALFGAVNFQSNGNRFIGWGASMSEYTQESQLLFHAEWDTGSDLSRSYRAYKGPWIGRPTTDPDVFSYSWTCFWDTTIYVSWNGATEVVAWRVLGSAHSEGPFSPSAAAVTKVGFETKVSLGSGFVGYVVVEALDAKGEILGRSKVTQTRVPPTTLARICTPFRCPGFAQDLQDIDISYTCHFDTEKIDIVQEVPQVVLNSPK